MILNTAVKRLSTSQFPGRASKYEAGYYAAILFPTIFLPTFAQETPPLINYPSSLYKAHNQNWEICQSTDQMIYSANSDGLLETRRSSYGSFIFARRADRPDCFVR